MPYLSRAFLKSACASVAGFVFVYKFANPLRFDQKPARIVLGCHTRIRSESSAAQEQLIKKWKRLELVLSDVVAWAEVLPPVHTLLRE